MDRAVRIIAWAAGRLRALDWRALGRHGTLLAGLFIRYGLVLIGGTVILAGRVARASARGAMRLARRRPRVALGAGVAVSLAVAVALLLRPAPVAHVDLGRSLDCLALNIYHEARGEPLEGKIAVAQVVLNRVGDPAFPAAVCKVIKQGGVWPRNGCQFTWWCDGQSDRPDDVRAWEDSKGLARRILAGRMPDPTRGALWYHADHVSPDWRAQVVPGVKIGRHLFYLRPRR